MLKFGSLFSGIGGFDLGFEQAGLECAWQVEIDKDCNRVLARQFPNVTRFDDVTTIREFSAVDVICGGFPCQDLSVAGKRAGLAGERSGLWFEFLRIIKSSQPRWVVIENVPGLLSSDEGRDFAAILRGLVNVGYRLAWRVFDAQYFGVAQRRRRVFIVGSLGNGSCAEILFERESVSWNPPTRREARAGVARAVADSLTRSYGKQPDSTDRNDGPVNLVMAPHSHYRYEESETANTLQDRQNRQNGSCTFIVKTDNTKSNGWGVLDDGTTRTLGGATDVVAFTLHGSDKTIRTASETDVAGSVRTKAPGSIENSSTTIVAFSSKDHGADAGSISPTLRAQNFKDSHINGGGQVAIAFAQNSRDEVRVQGDGNISGSLSSEPGMKQTTYLAFHENKSGQLSEADVLGLRSGASHSYQGIGGNFGVRRLTPRECERLQGFPDDWTRLDSEGKEISDSARYRMLGNAVAVPNAKWIGKRLRSIQREDDRK